MTKVAAMSDKDLNEQLGELNAINEAAEHDMANKSATELISKSYKTQEETGKLINSDGAEEKQKKDV